ncbi:hypothetical protein RUM43_008336 [Polyplax serrata]|uniref:Importin-13 n=1 Tax=Polyplax serrata TaxID=468196 RepID=A0AAN8P305_POLSC
MEFTSEDVERAVSQFYQSAAPAQSQEHVWLEKAKNSQEAWVFVWELLQPQKTQEVQFFAATTLLAKIKKYLHELTPENVAALREKLLTTIVAYSTGPKIVLNKLCTCLSSYIFQMCPQKWPDALSSLLALFNPENSPNIPAERLLCVLFEILTVLSEDFSTAHLTQHHKGLICNHLIENTQSVITLLEKVLSNYRNEEVTLQAVKCASAWITIGVQFSEYQNLNNIIVNLVFNTHKHHSSICEKCLEFLKVVVDLPDNYKYPTYLLEFMGRILPLGEIITRELAEGESMDEKLISNIYHLFLTFGGTHSRLCLNWLKDGGEPRENVLILISYILQCSAAKGYYPKDETYSRLPFGFWYVLQDEIILSSSEDHILFMKYLGPIYEKLVNILITKAQLPGVEQNFSKQDLESFRCYRQDISDTLLCEININECKWQELEACLFSLCSVSESVNIDENALLPSLFQYIGNIPFHRLDPKVLSTALETIGAYSSWIAAHTYTLEYVLPLIISGLSIPEATSSATMALKDIARDCQCDIKPYTGIILNASQQALHVGRLKLNDSQRLMCTIGLLLSALPLETIMQYLNLILTPYMEQLNALSLQAPSTHVKNNILLCLKLLGVLSATLNTKLETNSEAAEPCKQNNDPQPVLLILQKLLPVIKSITNSWSADDQVMQAVFVLLKHAVTTLVEDVQSVVTDILDLIVCTYRVHPQPAALDLSKTLSTLFGKDEKYQPIMQSLTNELCSVAMGSLASAQNLSDHTDMLEALFEYLSQVVRRVPKLIMCTDTAVLFQCAMVILTVPELPSVKAASQFLVNFINQSVDCEPLARVVNAYGQQLVHKMICGIAGESSRSNIEPLGAILLSLNRYYCESNSRWLRETVTKEICPRSTSQQRETFISMVLHRQRNKEQLLEAVRKFSLICRGIVGTEYGQRGTPYF